MTQPSYKSYYFSQSECPHFQRNWIRTLFGLVASVHPLVSLTLLRTSFIVTGCSSGLGRSFATVIHKAGHRIVATARNIESLSFLPDAPSVLKLKLDVTSLKDIEKSVNDAVEAFGRIDILINNAGYGLMGDTEAVPEADARLQLETNFWGPVHITRAILPIFREINAPNIGGTIVQISSMGGWLSFPGGAFYHSRQVIEHEYWDT